MARRRNEIAVDKGQINRVNVKHILGDLDSAVEGTEVCVKFWFQSLLGEDYRFVGVATPEEDAQKEQGNSLPPIHPLSNCGARSSSSFRLQSRHDLRDILSFLR